MLVTKVVFVLVLVGLLGLSAYLSRRIKTVDSFYIADRGLSWVFIAGTLIASWVSAGTILGMTATHFKLGMAPLSIWAGGILSLGFLFMFISPYLWRAKVRTIPQFIEKRFNSRPATILAGIWVLLAYYFYMAGSVLGMGYVFSVTLGIPYTPAIIIGLAATVYMAAAGGALTVIWTDLLSAFIGVIGIIVAVAVIFGQLGGIGGTVDAVAKVDPKFWTWNYGGSFPVLATMVIWIGRSLGAVDLHSRFLAARDERDIFKAILTSTIVLAIITFGMVFVGAGVKILIPDIAKPDYGFLELMTRFVNPFFAGIGLSAVAVLATSTLNTQLLVSSQAVGRDIVSLLNPNISDKNIILATRLAAVVIGILLFIIGIIQPAMIVDLMTIAAGIITYGFVVPVILGIWWKRGHPTAFIVSSIVGIIIQLFSLLPGWSVTVSVNPILIGLPVVTIIYVVLSLTLPASEESLKFQRGLHLN